MTQSVPDEAEELISGVRALAHLATCDDGRPHAAPVWYRYESGVDDESGVVRDDIVAWLESAPFFDDARSIETGREGRSAVVTVRRSTAALDEITPRV
jgi:hypothetical protein